MFEFILWWVVPAFISFAIQWKLTDHPLSGEDEDLLRMIFTSIVWPIAGMMVICMFSHFVLIGIIKFLKGE